MSTSGLYRDAAAGNELRLDVDGSLPQMRASGTWRAGLAATTWIATVAKTSARRWRGNIAWRSSGGPFLPFSAVRVRVQGSVAAGNLRAVLRFYNGASLVGRAEYRFESPFFHPVEFEFDAVAGTTPVTSIETHAHPNRPGSLASETLTLGEAYRRAGLDVRISADPAGVVPLALAGSPGEPVGHRRLWDDNEIHDAMQAYWSRFDNRAQWALWVLYAGLHEPDEPTIDNPNPTPEQLGGLMFDSIGPNHRQGTAIFNDAFISRAPAGDPAPAAWVRRMRFWTAAHEMGHAFNLAHAWQKHLGTPWRPLQSDLEARSFMNYPYRVVGGERAFFRDFAFRFSDDELEFLRHAPERYVQMGNADWFDDHAFRHIPGEPSSDWQIELRVNRDAASFDFLEPVTIELKVKNVSGRALALDPSALVDSEGLMVISKREGRPARSFLPYVRACRELDTVLVAPGQSVYRSLFVAAGLGGWDVAEPGPYSITAALQLGAEHAVSRPLELRIATPRGRNEENLAQDYFTDPVGRVLAFDGSQFLVGANDVLRRVADEFRDRPAAIHANLALASALGRPFKRLELPAGTPATASAQAAGGRLFTSAPDNQAAAAAFEAALQARPEVAAETLGHVDYKFYADRYTRQLVGLGDTTKAAQVQSTALASLTRRKAHVRVLAQIDARVRSLSATGV